MSFLRHLSDSVENPTVAVVGNLGVMFMELARPTFSLVLFILSTRRRLRIWDRWGVGLSARLDGGDHVGGLRKAQRL